MFGIKTFAAAAVMAAALTWGGVASAATVDCALDNPNVTDRVSVTSACLVIQNSGNVNTLAEFNALTPFGFNNWTSLGKTEPVGTEANIKITGNAGNIQGAWEILANGTTSLYNQFALLLKAGNTNNTSPDSQVIYLTTATSGTWMSPLFVDTNGNACTTASYANCTPRALSHFEIFARNSGGGGGGPGEVPLPAALPLLLGGLGALGLFGRRKAKKA